MKKKEQPYYQKWRFAYSCLRYKKKEFVNGKGQTRWEGSGSYFSAEGWGVRICAGNWTGTTATNLDFNYMGYSYTKVLYKEYSERGLRLVCANFIKEVIDGTADDKLIKADLKKRGII